MELKICYFRHVYPDVQVHLTSIRFFWYLHHCQSISILVFQVFALYMR